MTNKKGRKKVDRFSDLFADPSKSLEPDSSFFRLGNFDCLDSDEKERFFPLLITMFHNRSALNAETQDDLMTGKEMNESVVKWKEAYKTGDNTLLMDAGLVHYIKGMVIITGPAKTSKTRIASALKVRTPPDNVFAKPIHFKNWRLAKYYLAFRDYCDDPDKRSARTKKIIKNMEADKSLSEKDRDISKNLPLFLESLAKNMDKLKLFETVANNDIKVKRHAEYLATVNLVKNNKDRTAVSSTFALAQKEHQKSMVTVKQQIIDATNFSEPFSEISLVRFSGLEYQLRAKSLSHYSSLNSEEIAFIVMNVANSPITVHEDVEKLTSILSLAQVLTSNKLEIKWFSEKIETFPAENQVFITKYDTDELHYVKFRNIVVPIQLPAKSIVFACTFFGITYVNSLNQNFFDFKKSGSVQGGLPIGYIDAIANYDNMLAEYGRSNIVELRDDYSRNDEFEKKLIGAGSLVIVLNKNEDNIVEIDMDKSRIRPLTDFFNGTFASTMHAKFPRYLGDLSDCLNEIFDFMKQDQGKEIDIFHRIDDFDSLEEVNDAR